MSTLITKDMPEPKEYGPYLIATSDGKPLFIAHHRKSGPSTSWSDIEMEECSWYKLRVVAGGYTADGKCTIESLADHDARIRREALTHLSMTDIDVAIRAYENAKYAWDDNNMPLRMAFKAVAENRERVS